MMQEKGDEKQALEKQQQMKETAKTNNTFAQKDRIPNEQNAWKETQYKRGE